MVTVERTDVAPRIYAIEVKRSDGYLQFKRLLDITLACGIGILVFLPLLLVIGPVLWNGGPIFYYQIRIGSGGRRFRCYKFRTMVPDADNVLHQIFARVPEAKSQWDQYHKLTNDPRVTRLGRILRATSLDELPQLWNVLKGDMSLVGPRPIVEDEIPRYGKYFTYYISGRPGLTGVWQVYGRHNVVKYRRRVAMDVWYARNHGTVVDCVLLAKTVQVVFRRTGL
jgi:lipopolysaccharide/colanic/teichoic acid biosynthesis glycosyltransferase